MSSRNYKRAMHAQQQAEQDAADASDGSEDAEESAPRTGNAFGSLLDESDGDDSDAVDGESDAGDEVGAAAPVDGEAAQRVEPGRSRKQRRQDQQGADDEDVDQVLLELGQTLATPDGAAPAETGPEAVDVWRIDPKHLDGANELAARFGKDTMRRYGM